MFPASPSSTIASPTNNSAIVQEDIVIAQHIMQASPSTGYSILSPSTQAFSLQPSPTRTVTSVAGASYFIDPPQLTDLAGIPLFDNDEILLTDPQHFPTEEVKIEPDFQRHSTTTTETPVSYVTSYPSTSGMERVQQTTTLAPQLLPQFTTSGSQVISPIPRPSLPVIKQEPNPEAQPSSSTAFSHAYISALSTMSGQTPVTIKEEPETSQLYEHQPHHLVLSYCEDTRSHGDETESDERMLPIPETLDPLKTQDIGSLIEKIKPECNVLSHTFESYFKSVGNIEM